MRKLLEKSAFPTLHLPKGQKTSVSARKLTNKRIVSDLLLGQSEVEVCCVDEEPALPPLPVNDQNTSETFEVGSQCNLEPDHKCCLDWRNKYAEALNTIKQLEKKILKAKKLSKKEQTVIVKQHLEDLGHKETAIKHILKPGIHHKNYTQEDVCNALILRCMSNKSFEYLRRNKILPLPSKTTLSKWVDKLDCKPGFKNNFLVIVEKKMQSAESWEKDAIIMFDELDLKKRYEYDRINKQVYGGYKKLQCVIVRGLFSRWKQMIYFDFDTPMTKGCQH